MFAKVKSSLFALLGLGWLWKGRQERKIEQTKVKQTREIKEEAEVKTVETKKALKEYSDAPKKDLSDRRKKLKAFEEMLNK